MLLDIIGLFYILHNPTLVLFLAIVFKLKVFIYFFTFYVAICILRERERVCDMDSQGF